MGAPVIDWSYFRSLRILQPPDEPDIVQELAGIFSAESAARHLELSDAISQRNIEGIRHVAHSLLGTAVQIGAPELARLAGELEARTANGLTDDGVFVLAGEVCDAVHEAAATLEAGETPE
jgi:HPt (histidine-containing phosphotransfer) domain-containing protein